MSLISSSSFDKVLLLKGAKYRFQATIYAFRSWHFIGPLNNNSFRLRIECVDSIVNSTNPLSPLNWTTSFTLLIKLGGQSFASNLFVLWSNHFYNFTQNLVLHHKFRCIGPSISVIAMDNRWRTTCSRRPVNFEHLTFTLSNVQHWHSQYQLSLWYIFLYVRPTMPKVYIMWTGGEIYFISEFKMAVFHFLRFGALLYLHWEHNPYRVSSLQWLTKINQHFYVAIKEKK